MPSRRFRTGAPYYISHDMDQSTSNSTTCTRWTLKSNDVWDSLNPNPAVVAGIAVNADFGNGQEFADSVIRSPPLDSMGEERRASLELSMLMLLFHPSPSLYGTAVKLNVVSGGRKLFGSDLAIRLGDPRCGEAVGRSDRWSPDLAEVLTGSDGGSTRVTKTSITPLTPSVRPTHGEEDEAERGIAGQH
ncbi:hypothetical protein Q8A67_020558 [Cirrhinus molitorella]|uniref:Uncharacterized protein n=1 Tax=Cirrhinus molitorella TaxID=172907 RepID=A0AA88P7Z2_9TELE|nr:hypothetical protein Q8A67_020558 [Cirrhinus molitorella]